MSLVFFLLDTILELIVSYLVYVYALKQYSVFFVQYVV